ncbi:MAG: aminotransferase class I/II-fold pyridoxal phosphate-dependent enzyme [Bacteroidetes bacterium]|nr:aminotransferase class I/II-fold pyridoxal phosphate-dependent enzyme [Bacteroidota bacterium]
MFDKKFNEAIENIRLSPIVAISELAKKKSAAFTEKTGKKFILFQRGEIDFSTPTYIIEAAKKALDNGLTKYPKSGGEDEFKDAILFKLKDYNNAEGLSRDNVTCTYGGQEALELSFKLFEGKKGAGFAPCWSCVLENFVPYARIDFIEVPLRDDFNVDYNILENILKDVSFFYLNTPHNPTGKVFSEDEVRRIAEICYKLGVFVISDEAYERILYDGNKHFSPISLPYDNIISIFTLSKTYSMTGWRLGYLVTRNKRIPELTKLGDYTQTAGVTTFLQYAGKEALLNKEEGEKAITNMLIEFDKRRNALYNGLKSIEGIEFQKPEGAFYLFPKFTSFIPNHLDEEKRKLYIFEKLMDVGIITVYGSCFGKFFGDNIRFSFSTTPVNLIEEGISRITEVFK